MQQFKIGQKVELIANSRIAADMGAVAIILKFYTIYTHNDCLDVHWLSRSNGQSDGPYFAYIFRPLNSQLYFDFMRSL